MKFEHIISVFPILCALIGGIISNIYFDQWIFGAWVGLLIGLSPIIILITSILIIKYYYPERPDCLCGASRSNDYKYVGMNVDHTEFQYQCTKCSRSFIAVNNEFYELVNEQRIQRYKKSKRGKWIAL
jgi:hypothetical protein